MSVRRPISRSPRRCTIMPPPVSMLPSWAIYGVFDGLVKRLGEFGRNQHGEIGVFRVLVLVGVAVAVDHGDSLAAYAAFIMLLADDASRIHAEGADLILKGI